MVSLIAYFVIIRPVNVLITSLSVIVGGLIASVFWQVPIDLILAAISAGSIAAGGNTFNDYCDRELDRIQKAHRPIPAGRITPKAALVWSFICLLAGMALALFINGTALLIASWAAVLLLMYSWKWKRRPLVGNLSVALIAALAFIYGGVAVGTIAPAVWAALVAFFFHLGREIIKDMEDEAGDSEARAETLVVKYGIDRARIAVVIAFVLLIVALPLPFFIGGFRSAYMNIVLFGVLPVLMVSMFLVAKWSEPRKLHLVSSLLKLDMLVGLAALLIGRPGIQ